MKEMLQKGMNDYQDNLFYGAKPPVFKNGHQLRKEMTEAETVLWKKLRRKQLGVKFRRQHPAYQFILDFYCHEKRLAVEVDGSIHDVTEQKEYDERRTQELNELGSKLSGLQIRM